MGIKHKTIIVAVRNQEKEDAKICLTLRNALGYKTGRKKECKQFNWNITRK